MAKKNLEAAAQEIIDTEKKTSDEYEAIIQKKEIYNGKKES